MTVLIFGGNGMLGHKLVQQLGGEFDVRYTLRGSFQEVERFPLFDNLKAISAVDIEHAAAIRRAIEISRPDVVINAVGVVKQLPGANDVVQTLTVNSIFPHRLAEFAPEFGFRLIHISTDCVFSGSRGNYSEDDSPDARDLYGISKFLGEVTFSNCLTIRSSIIGRELTTSHGLVEWFLGNRGEAVKGYKNAIFSGFPTIVFAGIIRDLIADHKNLKGLYHISSEPISKFDLLSLIKAKYDVGVKIEGDGDLRIDRSLDSTRFRRETGFAPLPWGEMIELMARDSEPYDEWRK